MRVRVAIVFISVLVGLLHPMQSQANVKPYVESFTFTPNEIELISTDRTVSFELTVSHPAGIKNTTTQVTLTGPYGSTLTTNLNRVETPINFSLTKVTFKGTLVIPQNITAGAYTTSVAEVTNNSSAGYEFGTGPITANKIRQLIGAESALLIRNNGDLNLIYDTFVGPSYDLTTGITYNNPSKYNNSNPPIWKVGESYSPNNYFESRVLTLPLIVTSSTQSVCTTDGKELKFINTGSCVFKISTLKTKDYNLKEITQVVTITSARTKPELVLGTITNQTSKNLPKTIEIFRVYSPSGTWILPGTETPTVCVPLGFYVQLISGGTCILTFQSEATSTYLSSDLYRSSFEISRDPQSISFSLPATISILSKSISLTASASSGGSILYSTSTPENCLIEGTTLSLLKSGSCSVTASQPGSSTISPVSMTAIISILAAPTPAKKTITCIKGKKSKKVSGVNPKCPAGYNLKSR